MTRSRRRSVYLVDEAEGTAMAGSEGRAAEREAEAGADERLLCALRDLAAGDLEALDGIWRLCAVAGAINLGAQVDARRVSDLLARLAPKLREAVFLRHFAELTFAAAARVMGVPTFTAASRYRLALRRLRDWMGVE